MQLEEIVKYLVCILRINPFIQNYRYETPLEEAIQGKKKVTELLLLTLMFYAL